MAASVTKRVASLSVAHLLLYWYRLGQVEVQKPAMTIDSQDGMITTKRPDSFCDEDLQAL